jgi:formylglycine-generating enzyme required for sulfatase activity
MLVLTLILSPKDRQNFDVYAVNYGCTSTRLPFFMDGRDYRSTLIRVLEITANEKATYDPSRFSPDEQSWLVKVGVLDEAHQRFLEYPSLLAHLGYELYGALFPGESITKKVLNQLWQQAKQKGGLQIEFQFEASSVSQNRAADYPWELLNDGEKFLAWHQVGFCRYIAYSDLPPELPKSKKINALLISSRAFDVRQGLNELSQGESQAIKKGLELACKRGHINLVDLANISAPTFKMLQKYLTEHRGDEQPHILHFDGHGIYGRQCSRCLTIYPGIKTDTCENPICANQRLQEAQGYLVFEDDKGEPDFISAEALGSVLQNVSTGGGFDGRSRLSAVVLSACQSGMAAAGESVFNGTAQKLIEHSIPAVVAMQYSVGVEAASQFAEHFYTALGQKDSLSHAVLQSRIAMGVQGNQWYRPVLYLRWQDNEGGQLFLNSAETSLDAITSDSTQIELRRSLEAAMPEKARVGCPTEIWVKVSKDGSLGLRAELPDYTESGELIKKSDAISDEILLDFPVDPVTGVIQKSKVLVFISSPMYEIYQPEKWITVPPDEDSHTYRFLLTPTRPIKYGRVLIECFKDPDKEVSLGSLVLISEILDDQENERRKEVLSKFSIKRLILPLQSFYERTTLRSTPLESATESDQSDSEDLELLPPLHPPHTEQEYSFPQLSIIEFESAVLSFEEVTESPVPVPDVYVPVFDIIEFHFETVFLVITSEEATPEEGIGEYVIMPESKLTIYRQCKRTRGFIEVMGDGLVWDMILIPGESFLMGSPQDELGRYDSEGPQHEVTVSPFFIGRYPVTQAQWQAVADLPKVERELDVDPSHFKGEHHPVEQVSWYDAVEFCARLTYYTGREYRLPSEAEWECACRAGTVTPFHFGETITTEIANYRGTEQEFRGVIYSGAYGRGPLGEHRKETTNVDYFGIANGFGLCDMHGNVSEWCLDHWHENYEGAPTDGSAWLPGGEEDSRVLRGGSWLNLPDSCRSASRDRFSSTSRHSSVGFRVVCSAPMAL